MMETKTNQQAEYRVGSLLASRLDDAALALAPDIGERLRFARERAVARARQARLQAADRSGVVAWQAAGLQWAGATAGGAGSPGPVEPGMGHGGHWSNKLVSLLPLLILVLGFLAIQDTLVERQIQAAAEVDAALLADDLPPQAYSDPGFAEFLRNRDR